MKQRLPLDASLLDSTFSILHGHSNTVFSQVYFNLIEFFHLELNLLSDSSVLST